MKTSPNHSRRLRLFYAAGPGNVIGTFRHWQRGEDDPTQVARTYSGQFLDACRQLDAEAMVVGSMGPADCERNETFVVEHRPDGLAGLGGWRYHAKNIRYGLGLIRSAMRFRADVVVATSATHWFMLWPLSLMGVRVIPTLHCALWPVGRRETGRVQRLIQTLNGWFWRWGATATLCVSPECERQLNELTGGRIGPVYQARALYRRETFASVPAPAFGKPFRVMYAGRIEQNKGVFDLVEIAAQLERQRPGGFTWDICGDGSALETLRKRVDEAGLSSIMQVHGRMNHHDMIHRYGCSDAVIVPTTHGFAEGLNKVAVEGVLAGRPVVTSRLSNAVDVLGDAVIEVPPEDVDAYAHALLELSENEALQASTRAACKTAEAAFYDPSRSWGAALRKAVESTGRGQSPAAEASPDDSSDTVGTSIAR